MDLFWRLGKKKRRRLIARMIIYYNSCSISVPMVVNDSGVYREKSAALSK